MTARTCSFFQVRCDTKVNICCALQRCVAIGSAGIFGVGVDLYPANSSGIMATAVREGRGLQRGSGCVIVAGFLFFVFVFVRIGYGCAMCTYLLQQKPVPAFLVCVAHQAPYCVGVDGIIYHTNQYMEGQRHIMGAC